MNLLARHNMLRQAALQMAGCPTDDVEELKQLAGALRIPALTDADAAVALLLLQTLIVTHGARNIAKDDIPDLWVVRAVDWIGDDRVAPDGDAARDMLMHILFGAPK